jgi:demethylmenaquinone methyltransferase/2-methoxy-6-polyprenyl-1,4-benzoquinol methylase
MKGPDSTKIKSIFSDVAAKYDKANQVLSLGIHHVWRKKLVEWSEVKPGDKILDCATGTGDVAITFQKKLKGSGQITGIDFCAEMLSYAPQKALKLKLPINFKVADVTQLPFPDNEFDVVSISFGIRNVENPVLGIKEMSRVLKPGGRLLILEFGQVRLPLIDSTYNWYSKKVLPKIGGWITNKPDAYEYLQESSARFPCGASFINLMKESKDLSNFQFKALSFGITYLYRATKRPKEIF